ncbi:MAG: hypothetical protein IJJ13_08280 [Lachnospiraceae bacterium]|nr:hypothetical protein [Lachnospiraceae bacterium]
MWSLLYGDGVKLIKLRNPFASFTVDYKENKKGVLEAAARNRAKISTHLLTVLTARVKMDLKECMTVCAEGCRQTL